MSIIRLALVAALVAPFSLALPGASQASEVCGEIPSEEFGAFEGIPCPKGKGTVVVLDQAELDAYLTDFGFDGRRVQNLEVAFNPVGDIDIYSPCAVSVTGGDQFIDINATRMRVFGRLGVTVGDSSGNVGEGIVVEDHLTLVSTEGDTGFAPDLALEADSICAQSGRTTEVGKRSDVNAIQAELVSTGDSSHSHARIMDNSLVTADVLRLVASRGASIGKLATLEVGDLTVTSTGVSSLSHAEIKGGASVVANNASVTSGNKATLGANSSVKVVDTFEMNAGSPQGCKISRSASVDAGATLGNCLP